ncbi:MAG TPA: PilZ domain-containing protein [Gammaproteobacteria bacterium]
MDERRAARGVHRGGPHCLFCGTAHGLARELERDDACPRCRGPLFPAEHHPLEHGGQRTTWRIAKEQPVSLYTAWPQERPAAAAMRDLSPRGMRLAVWAPLEANQIVKVESDVCAAVARVAHCRAGRGEWVVGLEFLTVRFERRRGGFLAAKA